MNELFVLNGEQFKLVNGGTCAKCACSTTHKGCHKSVNGDLCAALPFDCVQSGENSNHPYYVGGIELEAHYGKRDAATIEARRVEIVLIATFTESPSFNVRILCGGATIFYNSERLQGNVRLRAVGKILNIDTLDVGQYNLTISQEQYNAIVSAELTTALDDCYKVKSV